MLGGYGDTHKPPAEHCCGEVIPREREGRIYVAGKKAVAVFAYGLNSNFECLVSWDSLGGVVEKALPGDLMMDAGGIQSMSSEERAVLLTYNDQVMTWIM